VAAAAAAGLAAGVALGQMLQFPTGTRTQPEFAQPRVIARGNAPAADSGRMGVQPASATLSDDEAFLNEPEVTTSQARVPETLRYLNEITPSARDYDPR
jgi:hypothetical protein